VGTPLAHIIFFLACSVELSPEIAPQFLGQGFGGCVAKPGQWCVFPIWWQLGVTTTIIELPFDKF
jgi:hypothetical protein